MAHRAVHQLALCVACVGATVAIGVMIDAKPSLAWALGFAGGAVYGTGASILRRAMSPHDDSDDARGVGVQECLHPRDPSG
jgi:hypothetical protein